MLYRCSASLLMTLLALAGRDLVAQRLVAAPIGNINSASTVTGANHRNWATRRLPLEPQAFYAQAGPEGTELWVAREHLAYPVLVKDIWPGSPSSSPEVITPATNGCWFFAEDGEHGRSLWFSGGDAWSTRIVGAPTNQMSALSGLDDGPHTILRDGTTAYVFVNKQGNCHLYRVDEASLDSAVLLTSLAGVHTCVADVAQGVVSGPRLFALADTTAISGSRQLLVSDGTPTGTVQVRTFPRSGALEIEVIDQNVGRALFPAADASVGIELWVTGGSLATTALVRDANPGPASSEPKDLFSDGAGVYYACDDGVAGSELWRSDGFSATTARIVDAYAGGSSDPVPLGIINNHLLFVSRSSATAFSLRNWNGSQVGNLVTITAASNPFTYAQAFANNQLMFVAATAGVYMTNAFNWFTQQLTTPSADLGHVVRVLHHPSGIGFVDRKPADRIDGAERLWLLDAAYTSARPVRELRDTPRDGDGSPTGMFRNGDHVLCGGYGTAGPQLQRFDLATSILSTVHSFTSVPHEFTRLDSGAVVFVAGDGPSGREMWATTGQPGWTFLQPEIAPGVVSSDPKDLVKIGGNVFFSARDPSEGRELFRVDNAQVPTRVTTIGPGGPIGGDPQDLTAVGSHLFFTADDGAHGRELYRLDTANLTHQSFDLRVGSAGSNPSELLDASGYLYFVADLGSGRALYLWDAANNLPVAMTAPVAPDDAPRHLHPFGPGQIAFSFRDPAHGREPWWCFGSAALTSLAADLAPGAASSDPMLFAAAAGAYCVARGSAGLELYRLGVGGPGGAAAIDVHPTGDSFPGQLAIFRDTLVFAADDGVHGTEPWQFDPSSGQVSWLANIAPDTQGARSSFASGFFDAAGTMLISARDDGYGAPNRGRELFQIASPATVPPLVQPYGANCPVAGYSPQIQALGLPTIGNLGYSLQLQSAPPASVAILLIGLQANPVPVAGCLVHVGLPAPFLMFAFTDGSGQATVNAGVPWMPDVIGARFVGQYATLTGSGLVGASGAVFYRIGG